MPYLSTSEVDKQFDKKLISSENDEGFCKVYDNSVHVQAEKILSFIHSIRSQDLDAVVEMIDKTITKLHKWGIHVPEHYDAYKALSDLKQEIIRLRKMR